MNAGLYGGFRLVLLPRFDPAAVLDAFAQRARRLLDRRADDVLGAAAARGVDRRGPERRRAQPARLRVRRRADAARRDARVRARVSACGSSRATACRRRRRSWPSTSCSGRASRAPSACRCSASRSAASTSEDRPVPTGRARRGRRARPERDEGLLQPSRRDGGRDARRLVPHRRHRHPRRGRLSVDRRSQEGHDPARRLQRLPARARGSAA